MNKLNKKIKILFFGKTNDSFAVSAIKSAEKLGLHLDVFLGKRSESFPNINQWSGDYIISYLSPWIIPSSVLKLATKAAINLHPGPPEYPGIGCTNFAIYDQKSEFGITAHHMAPNVDTGKIISVKRFAIEKEETVFSLTQKCYEHIFNSYIEIINLISENKSLPTSPETWTRKPFKRVELDALCEISPEMSEEEVHRRVRAVTYPGMPGAYLDIYGLKFFYDHERQKK